jgi:hypothetical protein
MYFLSVLVLMLLAPAGSIAWEHLHGTAPLMLLVGKWFVFWSVGVRLTLAGLRQQIQPRFTSKEIFGIESDDALPIVRELGVANLATGVVGLLSLIRPGFVLPVAIAAMIFYGQRERKYRPVQRSVRGRCFRRLYRIRDGRLT